MLDIRVIISAMNKASRDIDQVKKDIQGVGDASKTSGGATEGFAGKLKSLMGTAAAAAGAIAAVGLAVKEAYEFVKEGAAIERLQDASAQMAASIGLDMGDVMDALKIASQGMVSDFDLMSAASRAMMLGVGSDSTEIAQLFEIAALRGRVLGVDTSQAFNDIVTGIGRASPLILDNLGIVFDAEQAYADYATSIGKTAGELSKTEQKQALVNAVIESSAPLLAETGGLAVDNAGKFEQFEAAISNLSNSVATELSPAFAIISGDMAGFVNDLATDIIPGVEETVLTFILAKTAMENFNNVDFGDFMHAMGLVIGLTSEEEVNAQTLMQAIREMNGSFGESAQAIFDTTDSFEAYSDAMAAAGYSLVYLSEQEWESAKAARELALGAGEATAGLEPMAGATVTVTDATNNAALAMQKYTEALLFKIASEGLSQEAAFSLAEAMGLVDHNTVAATKQVDVYQQMLDAGQITQRQYNQLVEDLADTIDNLPEGKTLEVTTNAEDVKKELDDIEARRFRKKDLPVVATLDTSAVDNYRPPTRTGTVVYQASHGMNQAVGGAVTGGNPYNWQEYGYRGEVFVPSADGFVLSRADAERALARALYGGESAIDPEAIGKAVAKALSGITGNKQGGGNVYNLTMPTSSNPADVRTAFELMEAWA